MHKLGKVFIIFIVLSVVYVDWGNVIESEVNLSLDTLYEVDVDNDGTKESDKSEEESSLTTNFLYCEKIKETSVSAIEFEYSEVISKYHQDNYSFFVISRVERPPNFKLI